MRPLQVFLPTLGPSTLYDSEVGRDAIRAFKEWRGELIMWLLPGLKEPVSWKEDVVGWVRAIPAEHLDRLEIHHIGKNGYVWGPGCMRRFPDGRIDGLLDAWLKVPKLGMSWGPSPEFIDVRVPRLVRDKIYYVERRLRLRPGPVLPIERFDKKTGSMSFRWPPAGMPDSISPSAESREIYGVPSPAPRLKGLPIAVCERTPKSRAVRVLIGWPEPLGTLFPPGDALDEMLACNNMIKLARESAQDPDGALMKAEAVAGDYVTEGTSVFQLATMAPTYAQVVRFGKPVKAFWETYGIPGRTITEAVDSKEWQNKEVEPVMVQRAWGPVGLFWALLLEELKKGRGLRSCENCGQVLRHADKQGQRKEYCGPRDNPTCFRARRAKDKRRSRARQHRSHRG